MRRLSQIIACQRGHVYDPLLVTLWAWALLIVATASALLAYFGPFGPDGRPGGWKAALAAFALPFACAAALIVACLAVMGACLLGYALWAKITGRAPDDEDDGL